MTDVTSYKLPWCREADDRDVAVKHRYANGLFVAEGGAMNTLDLDCASVTRRFDLIGHVDYLRRKGDLSF